jgi:hypothetical protein
MGWFVSFFQRAKVSCPFLAFYLRPSVQVFAELEIAMGLTGTLATAAKSAKEMRRAGLKKRIGNLRRIGCCTGTPVPVTIRKIILPKDAGSLLLVTN